MHVCMYVSMYLLIGSNSLVFEQSKKESEEDMEPKIEALKKELGYWESYLSSTTYIAGPEFTLAGE